MSLHYITNPAKHPISINVLSWKANLRVNLFSTGVFSSSELSSVGKQRWYKQQGSMESETHSLTQTDVSRHLQNNMYVKTAGSMTEKHRIKEQQQRACWKLWDKNSCLDLFLYTTHEVTTGVSNMLLIHCLKVQSSTDIDTIDTN